MLPFWCRGNLIKSTEASPLNKKAHKTWWSFRFFRKPLTWYLIMTLCSNATKAIMTTDEPRQFNTKYLIDTVLEQLENFLGEPPSDYYITGPYPDKGWKTKNGFLKGLEITRLLTYAKDFCKKLKDWQNVRFFYSTS